MLLFLLVLMLMSLFLSVLMLMSMLMSMSMSMLMLMLVLMLMLMLTLTSTSTRTLMIVLMIGAQMLRLNINVDVNVNVEVRNYRVSQAVSFTSALFIRTNKAYIQSLIGMCERTASKPFFREKRSVELITVGVQKILGICCMHPYLEGLRPRGTTGSLARVALSHRRGPKGTPVLQPGSQGYLYTPYPQNVFIWRKVKASAAR